MCAWGPGFQDTEVTSRTLRERIWGQGSEWGQQPNSVWAELYWVSVPPPRHRAMFSRPCSMALLPTQVCNLVEAYRPLCKTKAVGSFPGTEPCWEVHSPGRMCSGRGLGGPLCPAALWLAAQEMPGRVHCPLDACCICM